MTGERNYDGTAKQNPRRSLTVLLVLLLCCAARCLQAAPERPAVADSNTPSRVAVVTPFEPLPNHGAPIIRVRFANGVEGHFMIDTGASYCVMTRAMAARLGLRPQSAYYSGGGELRMGSDGGRQSEFVDVKSLFIGSVELTGAQFILVNDDDFFRFGDEKVDGLIGNHLMDQSALLINYPKRTLTLYIPGGLTEEEIADLRMDTAAHVPLKPDIDHGFVYHQYSIILTLHNNGVEATEKVYVDTGASSTSISQPVAAKLGLSTLAKRGASTLGDGSVWESLARVPELSVGDLNIKDFIVAYPGRTGGHEIPPLMGEDVLGYCVALWDFPAKTLYLRPALPPLLPIPANAPPSNPDRIDASRLRAAASRLPPIEYAASLTGSESDAAEEDSGDESLEDRARTLSKSMAGNDSDAERWNKLGDMEWSGKQHAQAMVAYLKSVALFRSRIAVSKPDDVLLRANFALALCDADLDDEAESVARALTVAGPKDPTAWTTLGRVLHRRSVRALTGSNRTVDITPDDLSQFRDLVTRLRSTPPSDEQINKAKSLANDAREAYDHAADIASDDYRVYLRRADFLADSGLGIAATLQALSGEDVNALAFSSTKDVVRDIERAADLAPSNVTMQFRAAQTAALAPISRNEHGFDFRFGKFWDSLSGDVRKSVQRRIDRLESLAEDPNKMTAARALEALGRIQYEIVQDYPLAEKTLIHALSLDPKRGFVVQTLGELFFADRRYADVVDIFGAASAKNETPLLHIWLAEAYAKLGQWDNAQTHIDAALLKREGSYQTNLLCALILLERSDDDTLPRLARAKKCLDQAEPMLGAHPDSERLEGFQHARAICLALSREPDKARNIALLCLTNNRTDTAAREIVASVTP